MAPVVLDPKQSGSIARTFAADGYVLRYRSWSSTIGESRGVIVLLNGIMSHSLWFFPLAKPLRDAGFKLVGADRRGSGANEAARGDAPSSKVLIDDACRIIERERLSDRPLYLVGWCWGAVLAMNLAAELSGRIDGLALLAPGLFPTMELKRRMAEQEPLARGQPESAPCLESPISEDMFTSGPFLDDFIVKDEHRLARFTPRFLAAMGKLGMGAPLPLVSCLTEEDLFVPAHAEMVLEGVVPPDERMDEGPFGEFTGYGTGMTRTPVFRVSAMTFRDGCIYQDVVSGHMEHLILPLPAIERRALADARARSKGVTRVSLVAPLTAIVAMEKTDDAEPRAVIEGLLRGDIYMKHVIVVDADVEPSDLRQVVAAVALNTQASSGVFIFPDEQGTPLDPSCASHDGRGSKMGIDATRKLSPGRRVTKNKVPDAVLDRVDLGELFKK